MATTNYTDKVTVIEAEWLNEADAVVHDILSAPTTLAEFWTSIGGTVNIDGGVIDGTAIGGIVRAAGAFTTMALDTDLPITEGGTGSSTASAARTALGVAIGSDVQAWDTQLDDIAALAVTDSNFIVGDGSNWVTETGATARTSLGLGTFATAAAASQAEQETGTSTVVPVTPGRQHYHPSAAKAWVNFNGVGVVAIRDSYNVSSITDNSVGIYTVNFTNNMSDANYAVLATCLMYASAAVIAGVGIYADDTAGTNKVQTTSAVKIFTQISNGTDVDLADVSVCIFGDM